MVHGKGEVLGLGVDPMGSGRTGDELLPTLSRLVGEATTAPAGPSRNGLELYLDPGVLPPNIAHNVNAVAALAQGARVVDVAARDTNFTDPSRDYPYAALIQALHARGILAYAWRSRRSWTWPWGEPTTVPGEDRDGPGC